MPYQRELAEVHGIPLEAESSSMLDDEELATLKDGVAAVQALTTQVTRVADALYQRNRLVTRKTRPKRKN